MTTKSYEMGYTIAEFDKTLHSQFLTKEVFYSCQDISLTQWMVSVADTLTVDINISEEPPRVIAMLSLPVLKVTFEFDNFGNNDTEQQELFLKRFFKYFHKGGG